MHLPVLLPFSVGLLVSCAVSGVAKRVGSFLKSAKLDSECREYNESWLGRYFVKNHGSSVKILNFIHIC